MAYVSKAALARRKRGPSTWVALITEKGYKAQRRTAHPQRLFSLDLKCGHRVERVLRKGRTFRFVYCELCKEDKP